jgi:hypothetical protein
MTLRYRMKPRPEATFSFFTFTFYLFDRMIV